MLTRALQGCTIIKVIHLDNLDRRWQSYGGKGMATEIIRERKCIVALYGLSTMGHFDTVTPVYNDRGSFIEEHIIRYLSDVGTALLHECLSNISAIHKCCVKL